MPIYHPALDSYHSAFRMLQILSYEPTREYDARALRILDFYAVFPQLITQIRLPREHLAFRRQFSNLENPYWFTGNPALVFARMEPLQHSAFDLLFSRGLVNSEKYKAGRIQLILGPSKPLIVPEAKTLSKETLDFLVNILGRMSFHGVGGLKDRTSLLEFRYDAA